MHRPDTARALPRAPLPCFAAALVAALACSGARPAAQSAGDPCGPGGRQRPLQIVATTTLANGDVLDWIPIESQTGGEPLATPPPPAPAPSPATAAPPTPASEPAPAGPPGTVPMLRPPFGFHCECLAGYVPKPAGDCVEAAANCVGPGEMASGKSFTFCCPGLVAAPAASGGSCQDGPPDANVCIRCGDGLCGAGERPCNCPSDCR